MIVWAVNRHGGSVRYLLFTPQEVFALVRALAPSARPLWSLSLRAPLLRTAQRLLRYIRIRDGHAHFLLLNKARRAPL